MPVSFGKKRMYQEDKDMLQALKKAAAVAALAAFMVLG